MYAACTRWPRPCPMTTMPKPVRHPAGTLRSKPPSLVSYAPNSTSPVSIDHVRFLFAPPSLIGKPLSRHVPVTVPRDPVCTDAGVLAASGERHLGSDRFAAGVDHGCRPEWRHDLLAVRSDVADVDDA